MDRYTNKPERENRYGRTSLEKRYTEKGRRFVNDRNKPEKPEQPGSPAERNTGFRKNFRPARRENTGKSDFQQQKEYRRNNFSREKTEYNKHREEGGRNAEREEKRFNRYDRDNRDNRNNRERKPFAPFRKKEYTHEIDDSQKEELRRKHYSKKKQLIHHIKIHKEDTELRLNRYISMSGVCSRRDADALILEGRVKVNGEVIRTVGIKVKKSDRVEVDEAIIVPERKVYLVLNKPKDYVTTVEDPLERKTVMALIEGACKERVYPIGRLDRQTTGVLLFTNDGDLSKKLTHPKYEHKKIYHVFLDRPLAPKDMETISKGIELEDGRINADEISYVSPDQKQVGIEIHSGRNRIVRRIFEHLGYRIERLDRVYFAGITKKNLPRGKWRFLSPEEVRILKIY